MLTLNRSEFAHALRAVLEHVGDAKSHHDWVAYDNWTLWATDGYTALMWSSPMGSGPMNWKLPTKEARELLRFVRPSLKKHDSEEVQLLDAPNPETGEWELHVGLAIPLDESIPVEAQAEDAGAVYDSEVYSLHPDAYTDLTLDSVWKSMDAILSDRIYSSDWVLQSGLVARFKSAEVEFGDRTHWYLGGPGKGGAHAAVVTVGSEFLGVAMGLGEPRGESDYALRDSTLEEWGFGGE